MGSLHKPRERDALAAGKHLFPTCAPAQGLCAGITIPMGGEGPAVAQGIGQRDQDGMQHLNPTAPRGEGGGKESIIMLWLVGTR